MFFPVVFFSIFGHKNPGSGSFHCFTLTHLLCELLSTVRCKYGHTYTVRILGNYAKQFPMYNIFIIFLTVNLLFIHTVCTTHGHTIGYDHRVYSVPGFLYSRPNWVRPPPHPQASVAPPPLVPEGGDGTHSLAGEVVGGPNSDDKRESLGKKGGNTLLRVRWWADPIPTRDRHCGCTLGLV